MLRANSQAGIHNAARGQSVLDIKQKWEIEAQLGKMLRDAEGQAQKCREAEFKERLEALISEHCISSQAVTEILQGMSQNAPP